MKNAQACDNVTDGEMFEQLMRARNTNFSTEQDQTLAAVEHYYLAKRTNMPFQFMKGAYWGAMDLLKFSFGSITLPLTQYVPTSTSGYPQSTSTLGGTLLTFYAGLDR